MVSLYIKRSANENLWTWVIIVNNLQMRKKNHNRKSRPIVKLNTRQHDIDIG
jgi:hypothetical protein